jgi:hypothetical protein
MREAEFGRAFWLMVRELAKVIVEPRHRASIEPGPEGRFADGLATGSAHSDVIVSDPADHVCVGFDVSHFMFCVGR